MPEFQWDSGNTKHVIQDYPERQNTIEEVESVFADPNFQPVPDRVDSRGEQQYSGVGLSNQNRLLFVAFTVRDGYIRPFSCRPASRKSRNQYAQDSQKTDDEYPQEGGRAAFGS
ncbi:hypothetical protein F5984_26340 [Rudanella paleaurantiibacter]|uniref:BrnT family toxin n=1 Tax=Rudanella paleaurantiibacter TaxID=2614655 RepID=A0A7J5TRT3_9BACT|nr:BrnT family toxin [Rudanella paleaurantiibacter]KAB7725228.1 hypothetical protein F5984_26340 [Rudanella paleaurantiibacter]